MLVIYRIPSLHSDIHILNIYCNQASDEAPIPAVTQSTVIETNTPYKGVLLLTSPFQFAGISALHAVPVHLFLCLSHFVLCRLFTDEDSPTCRLIFGKNPRYS